MGKLTISMAIFNSKLLNYQRDPEGKLTIWGYIDISHTYPNPSLPPRGPILMLRDPSCHPCGDFCLIEIVGREMSTKFLACGMLNAFWWYLSEFYWCLSCLEEISFGYVWWIWGDFDGHGWALTPLTSGRLEPLGQVGTKGLFVPPYSVWHWVYVNYYTNS